MNGNFYRAYSFVTFKVISALILPFPRPLRQYKKPPCADIAPAYNGDALLSHSDRNILHNTKHQKIKEKICTEIQYIRDRRLDFF